MIYKCPKCGADFRSDVSGVVVCPTCSERVMVLMLPKDGTEWDKSLQGDYVNAFFNTVKKSILKPVEHFEEVRDGRGYLKPLVYITVISMFVFLCAAAYQAGFQAIAVSMDMASKVRGTLFPFFAFSAPLTVFVLAVSTLIGVPLFVIVMTFIQAGICHLCLMIVSAANRGYEGTFRTICYASGPQVIQILPLLGGFVGPLWQMALTIVGFKVVHRTSYVRSVVAVFLPMMICCGLILLIIVAIAGGTMGSLLKGNVL